MAEDEIDQDNDGEQGEDDEDMDFDCDLDEIEEDEDDKDQGEMVEMIENDAEMANGGHDAAGFGSDDEDRANRAMGFGQMSMGQDDDPQSTGFLERSLKSAAQCATLAKSAQSVGTSVTTQKTYGSGYRTDTSCSELYV